MTNRNRVTDPRGRYIRMASGEQVFLESPSVDQIRIPDVVTHLAGTRRFNGNGISVAQHCVVAAKMASRFYPDSSLLPARMMIHDVAEHILGDVSSPLKALLPDYKRIEADWDLAVEERFGLTFIGNPEVKEVDDRMWMTERLIAQPMLELSDDYDGPLEEFDLEDEELLELFSVWPSETAEHEYLVALYEHLPWIR